MAAMMQNSEAPSSVAIVAAHTALRKDKTRLKGGSPAQISTMDKMYHCCPHAVNEM
ncbi:hypothetical protein [Mesorhizobium sp. NZP2298]|uniref:hypothetical protein n=1 Tax=Mesorhizobium sp. NZP2298 TaxID=2483403 RepID=UPI0015541152|nr:hypothetical protein [Mesorhizobium sp. NZP2298]